MKECKNNTKNKFQEYNYNYIINISNKTSFDKIESEFLTDIEANSEWSPYGIVDNHINGYEELIVPNIIHYIILDCNFIDFAHYLSIKSVLKHQNPDKIMIHSNYNKLEGKYWMKLKDEYKDWENTVIIRLIKKPETVYGIKFLQIQHCSDIVRMKVLMEFGGIYLDRDVVIVKSLDKFRKFEFTVDLVYESAFGNQVIIAHKRARFLRLWLKSYQNYDGSKWYWNAGEYPYQTIINIYPHLVHLLNGDFGVKADEMCPMLYLDNIQNWREQYFAFHILLRGNSLARNRWCFDKSGRMQPEVMEFDENNIKILNSTFGQLARYTLYDQLEIMA